MKKIFVFLFLSTFSFGVCADEQLDKVLQELQSLSKDLKTLEKAVYSKSFSTQSTGSSEGVPAALEGALTRQLVKLSELEEQIQKITASNEETLFSLQKISERVEKIQRDTELRFSELGSSNTQSSKTSGTQQVKPSSTQQTNNSNPPKQFPGTGKMQDFGKVLEQTEATKSPSREKQEIRSVSPAPVVKTTSVAKEKVLPKGSPNE